ncbi:NEP1-interacting protein-like 1 isoform X2 [Triticum dicoccoides]|uniref:NEP1-interacting protein-like 1 isoform X2 n=1 Tax=Triticum dicoccoides TaxID=85692 RepID=UPI00188FA045|nr:NEP1-interacting protein-like 1 isoform X2 [Triticum dicoccoides]
MFSALSQAAGVLLRSLIAAVFGAAGTVIGALGGIRAGFINEDGMMQGALMGAITGAIVSVELAKSLLSIFLSNDYSVEARIRRMRLELQHLTAAMLLRGSVFGSIGSALDSQIDALQRQSYQREPGGDLFEPSYHVMAAGRASVDRLPVTQATKETVGQQTTCPICLHEFQAGESARRLPACCHLFHLVCIDNWLMLKSDCPVCRHTVY